MNVLRMTQSVPLLTTESVITQMVPTVVSAYQVSLRVIPMAYVEVTMCNYYVVNIVLHDWATHNNYSDSSECDPPCHHLAECTNTSSGTLSCQCRAGYDGDGINACDRRCLTLTTAHVCIYSTNDNIYHHSVISYHLYYIGCCVISATYSYNCNCYCDMPPPLLHQP